MQSCRRCSALNILCVVYVTMTTYGIRTTYAASGSYANCNKAHVVNNHHPTSSDTADYEHVLPSDQTALCPPDIGGKITKVECLDNKGEAVTGHSQHIALSFETSCSETNVSISCKKTDNSTKPCPDFSLSLRCDCFTTTNVYGQSTKAQSNSIPTTASTTRNVHASVNSKSTALDISTTRQLITSRASLLTTSKGSVKHDSNTTLDQQKGSMTKNENITIGGITLSIWILILAVCVLLFIFNVVLTLCLYKKAVRARKQHDRANTVNPLHTV